MTIPDVQDSRNQSPVFYGFDLARKPRSRSDGAVEEEGPTREDFVTHGRGKKACMVCLVGKPGKDDLLDGRFAGNGLHAQQVQTLA